jgi:nucleotide-binding universal stress UspA family protein
MAICASEQVADAEAGALAVTRHLQTHGVTARSLVRIAAADAACVQLNIEAEALGEDLIVAGAYGHSRTREWMLGGVTHSLLHNPERFVFLSH